MSLTKLRLIAEAVLPAVPNVDDTLNEVSLSGLISKVFGKDKKKKDEVEPIPSKVITTNFKIAYDKWYLSLMVKLTDQTPQEFCDMLSGIMKRDINAAPNNYMVIPVSAFNKEYNLTKAPKNDGNGSTKDLYIVAFDYKEIVTTEYGIQALKTKYGMRFFTDIVDNAVRIEMYDHKGYKPKPYISMENIEAAQRYLDSQNSQ